MARADSYGFTESFSRTGAFNPTGTLSLSNVNGDVVVETWDKNEILIEGEKAGKTAEDLKLIELTIDLSETSAKVVARLPKRPGSFFGNKSVQGRVSFHIKVPAGASLERIQVVNASVSIEGVRGGARVDTVNGRISARGLGGNIQLETVNGTVDARFSSEVQDQEVRVKTVNGTIKVALPADVRTSVNASVVNGHIDIDFPIKVQGRIGSRRLSGQIGEGGGSLRAESVNGTIRIEKT